MKNVEQVNIHEAKTHLSPAEVQHALEGRIGATGFTCLPESAPWRASGPCSRCIIAIRSELEAQCQSRI
jgi:hypothetical protein